VHTYLTPLVWLCHWHDLSGWWLIWLPLLGGAECFSGVQDILIDYLDLVKCYIISRTMDEDSQWGSFFNMVKRIQWELLWWLESMLLKCLLYSRYRKCTCNFEIHYHKWSSWISNEASSGLPREPADTTSNTKFKWCRNHTSQHLVAERNNTEEMSSVKL